MLPDLSTNRETTVERVVDALRHAMFAGQLRPGSLLREVELAEEMRVSRGSVREALLRLTAEGLCCRSSFRSVQVKELSPEDIHDLFLTRRLIELSAVSAVAQASAADVKALYRAIDTFVTALGTGDENEADLHVHRAIVALHHSRRLSHIHDGLMAELRIALAAEYQGEDAVPNSDLVDRHSEFARMLRADQVDNARAQLEQRLLLAEERLIASSSAAIDSPGPVSAAARHRPA